MAKYEDSRPIDLKECIKIRHLTMPVGHLLLLSELRLLVHSLLMSVLIATACAHALNSCKLLAALCFSMKLQVRFCHLPTI